MSKVKIGLKDIERISGEGVIGTESKHKAADIPFAKVDVEDTVYVEDKRNRDIAEDSVSLYIAECSKTPLLTGMEEKTLSGRMELVNYLNCLEKQVPKKYVKSDVANTIKMLIVRLGSLANLLEKVFKKYHIVNDTLLSEKTFE